MIADDELDAWRDQWRARQGVEAPTPQSALADLGNRVRRESRRMRSIFILKIIITALFLAAAMELAIRSPGSDTQTFAGAIVVLLAAGWVIALLIWKGMRLSDDAKGTDDYLRLSVRRCRSALRANTFAVLLSICIFTFIAGWTYHQISLHVALSVWSFLLSSHVLGMVIVAVIAFVSLARHRRHKKRELAFLQALEMEYQRAAVGVSA